MRKIGFSWINTRNPLVYERGRIKNWDWLKLVYYILSKLGKLITSKYQPILTISQKPERAAYL